MRKAFQMAVEKEVELAEGEEAPEEYPHTIELGEYELKAKTPSEAHMMLLFGTGALGGSAALGAQFRFLRGALEPKGYTMLLTLLEAGTIDNRTIFGGVNAEGEDEEGIVDWLMELASERPTKAPTDSGASSQTTGKRSTGRSPGKGSTLSE